MSPALPPFTSHFALLAPAYDVVLSDVWGVVHNGVAATPDACDALARFRSQGGTVVLITNAPRPGEVVARCTLDRLGVPRAAYDGIVSSGDVTRALIAARAGQRVLHIGPERDLPIFEGLDAPIVPLEQADYAVCSGLADDTVETPQDYDDLIARMRARGLTMICANPDIVVERGDCAGLLRRRDRRSLRRRRRRGDLCRQAVPADLRPGAGHCRGGARTRAGSPARAGDRRFGAHRSQRRRGLRRSTACS